MKVGRILSIFQQKHSAIIPAQQYS